MNVRRVAAAALDPRDYVEGANRAFAGWGDAATFAWVFRGDADLLLVEHHGQIIAATGIVRRQLTTGERVAIMCGSWTSAAARGRGAFAAMLDETCTIARAEGAVMLGFVRAENASRRVLERRGAALHPAFYCRSTTVPDTIPDLRPVDTDVHRFASTFAYSRAEWRTQFLDRPNADIVCLGNDQGAAVLERAPDFDRVHAVSDARLLPALAARAHAAGRRLFWYSTAMPVMHCESTPGFVATLPPLACDWQLQNGDRV